MDPISLLVILAVVGLIVGVIVRTRKKKTATVAGSEGMPIGTPTTAPVSSSSSSEDPNVEVLVSEIRKVKLAVAALVRPVLIWATFQLAAGFFIGIGVIILLTDPGAFGDGGFVPLVIGGLINFVGILVAVSSGWTYLARAGVAGVRK